MKKLICDRCGEAFSPPPEWAQAPEFEYRITYIRSVPYIVRDTVDLCKDCQRDLYTFIHGAGPESASDDEIARVIDADERRRGK